MLPFLAVALCVAARAPEAGRSTLSGPELTYLSPDGRVKVHYTLQGVDALPDQEDVDPADGVIDTLAYVAEGAARMLDAFVGQDGWPMPAADGGLGGDDRLDIYLKDLPANGYAYSEAYAGGGIGGYVEVAPHRKVEFARETFESIVGHEVHHILEFTAGKRHGASWILEATATWAQYLVFDGDRQTRLAQSYLWFVRLRNPSRDLDDAGHGDLFEYAGMVWLRFLVDRGGGDRKLGLELWKAIGDAGDWVAGHDAFVRAHLSGLTTLNDAAAEFALWNAFACGNDDGLHYQKLPGTCEVDSTVASHGAPIGGATTSETIGRRGAAYIDVVPDCQSADLHLAVTATGRVRVHAIAVAPHGASDVQVKDAATGQPVAFDLPAWNQGTRVTVVATQLGPDGFPGGDRATFSVTPTVTGAYAPPSTMPPVKTLAVSPRDGIALDEGAHADLHANASYGTCADGRDVTTEVTWASTDPGVATVAGGRVTATGGGSATIYATAGAIRSNTVAVTVKAAPDEGGCATSGRGSGLLGVLGVLAVLFSRLRRPRPD